MKRLLFNLIVYWLAGILVFSDAVDNKKKHVILMPDLMKPYLIKSDDKNLYVIDLPSVYIYNRNDLRLIQKFGKAGEGPQEFKIYEEGSLQLLLNKEQLIVSSYGKLSYYKKDGTYIKESRTKNNAMVFPLGSNFLMPDEADDSKTLNQSITAYYLCDARLNKIKELARHRYPVDLKKRTYHLFSPRGHPFVYDDIVYFATDHRFLITAFNDAGQNVLSIKMDYERVRFPNSLKAVIIENLKKSSRRTYDFFKSGLIFPDYFPSIKNITVANNRIYVQTYKVSEDNFSEFFIFRKNGAKEKQLYLPLSDNEIDDEGTAVYTIQESTIYELVENVEKEIIELHITPFE